MDERVNDAMERVFEDKLLKHDCENCAEQALSPISSLPPGWSYVAMTTKLWEDLDGVDKRTVILCAICTGLVRKLVPKLGTV